MALLRIKAGHGHAGAIERNAVAQADVIQIGGRAINGEALAMGRCIAERINAGNAANAADDSCKHLAIFAVKGKRPFLPPFSRVGKLLKTGLARASGRSHVGLAQPAQRSESSDGCLRPIASRDQS